MSISVQKITPCLWFDTQGEEAARFYVSIFKNSKLGRISRYGKEGHEIHGMAEGTVLTVDFELEGSRFTALNGGPQFKFTEAVSFMVSCETQAEIDYYWDKLGAGGDPKAQQCGWLKDRFGLSWQIVPRAIDKFFSGPEEKSARAFNAMMKMKKLDIAALERAYNG